MLVFHCLLDAVLFGLHLQQVLGSKVQGSKLVQLLKYGCLHDQFLTMGPHRSTGRADYFGNMGYRAARLSSVVPSGSVCVGVFDSNNCRDHIVHDPSVKVTHLGRRALKGISEEISVYECTCATAALENVADGREQSHSSDNIVFKTAMTCAIQEFWRVSLRPQTKL